MPRIVEHNAVAPSNIKEGDVMLFTVKAMVSRNDEGLTYRLYRCDLETATTFGGIPQGMRVPDHERQVCEALFPSLAAVAEPDYR